MTERVEIAPAKLNLALHVRGKLPDGRHSIETIFAFCIDGDQLAAEGQSLDEGLSLSVSGPFAAELFGEADNLVLRAARALAGAAKVKQGAALRLDKRLPIASGIGGGSADAAAALRLLTALWEIDPSRRRARLPAELSGQRRRGGGSADADCASGAVRDAGAPR